MANEWISVKDRLPKKNGKYLCLVGQSWVTTLWFSKNLYKVDNYEFVNQKGKSGFYDYDSEYGHYENTDVTYWMPLPELPKGE